MEFLNRLTSLLTNNSWSYGRIAVSDSQNHIAPTNDFEKPPGG